MLRALRTHLSYANVVASIALFVALGGGAYAAITLPRNSVGAKQIKKNAVNTRKVKNHSLGGVDIKIKTLPKVPSAAAADRAGAADIASTAGIANGLAAPESWHEVGAQGEPPFKMGAGNPTAGADPQKETVAFFKDHDGIVHLKGAAESFGNGIFELPPGYRPAQNRTIRMIVRCDSCASPQMTLLTINGSGLPANNGLVVPQASPSTVSLDGVTFRAGS